MGCGRMLSTNCLALVTACVCVLLILTITDAKPASLYHPSVYGSNADLWTEYNKWRAFEPLKETSRREWWKEKLDDDLWNPKAHRASSGTAETSTEPQPITADKLALNSQGEKHVSNITSNLETKTESSNQETKVETSNHETKVETSNHETKVETPNHETKVETSKPQMNVRTSDLEAKSGTTNLETKAQSSASVTATSKLPESDDLDQPMFRKGAVNTFVEPDPASYYSSSGEYARKSWNPAYSQPSHRKEAAVSQERPEALVSIENQDPLVAGQSKKDIVTGKSKEPSLQQSKNGEDNTFGLKNAPEQNQAPLVPASSVSQMITEKVSAEELSPDVVPLNIAPVKELVAAPSGSVTINNTAARNLDKDVHINSNDVSMHPTEVNSKMMNVLPGQKAVSASIAAGGAAVAIEGGSLSLLHVGAVKAKVNENKEVDKKVDKVIHKKAGGEFVDWDGWDSSVFDYYDDEHVEVSEKKKKVIKEDNIESQSKNIPSKNKVDEESSDDDGDEDDFSDEEDDNEYEDEDELKENNGGNELIKGKNKKVTISASSNEKEDLSSQTQPPAKGIDFDSMDMQSDEAVNHADHSHYSKGIIYDSRYPSHKPSVKMDLANPGTSWKAEHLYESSPNQEHSIVESSDLQNVSMKKALSVTHYQPGQLNTESDVSTSPNPPPPGVARSKELAGTMAPGTTPLASGKKASLDADSLGKQKMVDSDGYTMSFPIEFCQVDYECRAGRTCVLGVCKCYTPAMCAGHQKPICGSDGVQYASHCELHRTACVNRVHIRADRRGRCFQKEIEEREKSWLMEQERLLQEDKKKAQSDELNDQVASQSLVQQPEKVKQEPAIAEVQNSPSRDSQQVSAVTDKTTTTETVTKVSRECAWKDMNKFRDDLLMFYCQKFVEPNCKEEVKTDREYLSMLMFSYYDKDYDYYLTAEELDDKERDEHFTSNIIVNCHLHDFIKYADNLEVDSKLTVTEFTTAFEEPIPSIPPHAKVEVISTLASAGNGLELKCGVDAETIVWRRHGAQLSDDKRSHQLMVFDDGALFFSTVGLHHIGNYTCMDAHDETNAQIHRLKVQTMPVVKVTPVTQTHRTGSDIELKCRSEGVPNPGITWTRGGDLLEFSSHITHYYGGGHIVIHNAQFDADAGTYTCSAHNQAGTTEKSVSVSVVPPSATFSQESLKEAGTFVVYHSKGISAYDPMSCLLRHQVSGDFGNFKFIPDALDGPLSLCRTGQDCQWGEAVKVGSEFIYVSQPDQNRVVVMDAVDTLNPVQVIDTDKRPEKLWYVKHLDQVWVLCGSLGYAEGNKTIVVIRDASQHIQHRSVHTQPVGNHFDMVQDLFIAPSNDLNHEFDFGYVSHTGQKGLFKINLEDMSYTKSIDLNNYGCVPTSLAFVPIGGHVVIQCVSAADQHTLQLTMDYLTDTITSATSHNGQSMASPDSRHLVTVDLLTGKVIITSVSDEGVLETSYELAVSATISDVVFMSAIFHHGYDLVLTAADDDDVIIINLVTGKMEKLKGSKYSDSIRSWNSAAPVDRHIVTANSMSNYLMTASRSSLVILDAKFKQVECEFLESIGSHSMIYIPSIYTS